MKEPKNKLHVVLLGMDERTQVAMRMFLERRCCDKVIVVEDTTAQVSVIDMDAIRADQLFQEHKAQYPERPIILLSLVEREPTSPGTLFVRKPVRSDDMISTLDLAKSILNRHTAPTNLKEDKGHSYETVGIRHGVVSVSGPKRSIHQVAMGFDGREAIRRKAVVVNLDDQKQINKMCFDPRNYMLGIVLSAFRVAHSKQKILRLEMGWKPIMIFPEARQIWVDAVDKQLRSVAKVPVSAVSSFNVDFQSSVPGILLSSANSSDTDSLDPDKYQSMDAFLWKLALWTANGRVPDNIDLNQPVFLSRWPNLTRCIASPHALRIAALMVEGPRTLLGVANALNIRHEYVLTFFTAAYALGIAGQAKRQSDSIVEPLPIPPPKHTGIFKEILSRLRGS